MIVLVLVMLRMELSMLGMRCATLQCRQPLNQFVIGKTERGCKVSLLNLFQENIQQSQLAVVFLDSLASCPEPSVN